MMNEEKEKLCHAGPEGTGVSRKFVGSAPNLRNYS
jgi:hypothetical protein